MKILITGIEGFVAPFLAKALMHSDNLIYGTHLLESNKMQGVEYIPMNLLDASSVNDSIGKIKPEVIYHLAGFSSVAESWKKPELVMQVNAGGTKNLLEAVVNAKLSPRIIIISSAEVYGKPQYLPLDENHPIGAFNPYAASRFEQEKIIEKYTSLDIVLTRSFNHTGPNQPSKFVCPAFAKQIAQIEKGELAPQILHGNLDIERDFSDVRDVVKAYVSLIGKGKSHEAYNVCSGKSYSIKQLLEMLVSMSSVEIETKIDPEKVRPAEIPVLLGSNAKICNETGWQPCIGIRQTLQDLLDSYRA